nr:MAG TPA: zinc-ribbon domain protein [Caudoviricetes sp.]
MKYHPRCGACGSRVNKIGVDKCAGCQKKELEKEAN